MENNTAAENIKTLQHIKDNPGCDSEKSGMDGNIIKKLHDAGLVEGNKFQSINASGPEFLDLNITLAGEEYLLESEADKKPLTPHWYHNPFVRMVLGVIGALIVGFIMYLLKLYFEK